MGVNFPGANYHIPGVYSPEIIVLKRKPKNFISKQKLILNYGDEYLDQWRPGDILTIHAQNTTV